MRDDESEDTEDLPPDDPTSALERLDAGFESLGPPEDHPSSAPSLSRREIEDLVDQVLTEALSRLSGENAKP